MNTSRIPFKGWQFKQKETGWEVPNPTEHTFSQVVDMIIEHRKANPELTKLHHLQLMPGLVGLELAAYNIDRGAVEPDTVVKPFPQPKPLISLTSPKIKAKPVRRFK